MSAFARALAAFKLRQPEDVQAETDALAERLLAPLDALDADFKAALGRMHADGSLPDRRRRPRMDRYVVLIPGVVDGVQVIADSRDAALAEAAAALGLPSLPEGSRAIPFDNDHTTARRVA